MQIWGSAEGDGGICSGTAATKSTSCTEARTRNEAHLSLAIAQLSPNNTLLSYCP